MLIEQPRQQEGLLAQKEKAVEIVIFAQTDIVGCRGDVLKSAKNALGCNNVLKVCVCSGQARRPECRSRYSRCLRVKIPRRRFEQARADGRLERLLRHRVFRRDELQIIFPAEIWEFKREQLRKRHSKSQRSKAA